MPALDKPHIRLLKKSILSYAEKRRDMIKSSGDALHHAKRAIFSLHRGNEKEAKQKIDLATKMLTSLEKKFNKLPQMLHEGSYKAAVEEYVEAVLFYQFVTTGKIGKVKTVNVEPEVYIAGLCDVPGELYRYAINAATHHDEKTVKACADLANEIVGELIEFNLTSYLRNKFDQAKQAVHKLEKVVYELSLKQ